MATTAAPGVAAATVLKNAKRALRRDVARRMRALTDAQLDAYSAGVATRVMALPQMRQCRSVSVYLNMPRSEIRTSPQLVEALLERGLDVFVPKVDGTHPESMRMLRLDPALQTAGFAHSKWGIPEPSSEAAAAMLDCLDPGRGQGVDMVLVPAVAFDRGLNRLGHGGGYYDSFIRRATEFARARDSGATRHGDDDSRSGTRPFLVGLACPEQVVDAVPTGDWDIPLDCLVLPDQVVCRNPKPRGARQR